MRHGPYPIQYVSFNLPVYSHHTMTKSSVNTEENREASRKLQH